MFVLTDIVIAAYSIPIFIEDLDCPSITRLVLFVDFIVMLLKVPSIYIDYKLKRRQFIKKAETIVMEKHHDEIER